MQLFNNVEYINQPLTSTSICISCDDLYFKKFGQYTILSCIRTAQSAHCHIINPSEETKSIVLSLIALCPHISFSYEHLDITNCNPYKLLTYYFCSRFFIAQDLMKNKNIDRLWVTDTDVIFDQIIEFPEHKKLCVDYNPLADNLWKGTTGNIFFIHKDKIMFLSLVIDEYLERFNTIDFNLITPETDKITRSNLTGLDQVSMSVVIKKYFENDEEFSGLNIIKDLKGKHRGNVKVWIPVGKSKDIVRENGFKDIL